MRRCHRLIGLLLLAACAPAPEGLHSIAPETTEPQIRVALVRQGTVLELGGGDALNLLDQSGFPMLSLASGAVARLEAAGDMVRVRAGGAGVGPVLRLEVLADPAGLVRVAGREYRGRLVVTAAAGQLLVINRLGIESYLAGVVNAEMGRRADTELEALLAQAVVSRTYALQALARGRTLPWDVVATVSDQAYLGVGSELEQSWNAVRRTQGQILEYQGEPIDPFFHSTCGGRTAAGDEVFQYARRPYLQSVSDAAPDGTSWCAISPRYRWTESWSAAALAEVLRATLPPLGLTSERQGAVRDVSVTGRSPSGRVAELTIAFEQGSVPVRGQAVRQALRPSGIDQLRSANFGVVTTRSAGRLQQLSAEGGGAGHGVGMCQWGAVGRARAGWSASAILATYFPGAMLARRW